MSLETEVYQILRTHKLTLKKREEVIVDLLELINRREKQLNINVVMPRTLTAENGDKDLLIGEFVECFDPDNSGNPYIVPITWDSIKNIYKKIASHYGA